MGERRGSRSKEEQVAFYLGCFDGPVMIDRGEMLRRTYCSLEHLRIALKDSLTEIYEPCSEKTTLKLMLKRIMHWIEHRLEENEEKENVPPPEEVSETESSLFSSKLG